MALKFLQSVGVIGFFVFGMGSSENPGNVKILVSPEMASGCPTVYHGVWGVKSNSMLNTTEETIADVSISPNECKLNSEVWKTAEAILKKHETSSCSGLDSRVLLSLPRSFDYNNQKKCSDIYIGSASLVRDVIEPSSKLALSSIKMVSRSCEHTFQQSQLPLVVIRRHQNCSHQGGTLVKIFALADSFVNFFGLKNNTFIKQVNQESMKLVKQFENAGKNNQSGFLSAVKIVTSLEHDEETIVAEDVVGDWSGVWAFLEKYAHLIVRIVEVTIGALFLCFALYVYNQFAKATSTTFGWIFRSTPTGGHRQEMTNTHSVGQDQQPNNNGVTQV